VSIQNDRLLLSRYAEAYIYMAKRLEREAQQYAVESLKLEESMTFHIGHADFSTNRALVYTIEAARQLCGGFSSRPYALRLLQMAQAAVEAAPAPGEGA
jgi:hypothetical protein